MTRLVAVYESDADARAAAAAARRTGVADNEIRIADPRDRLAAVRGEMRTETDVTNEAALARTVGTALVVASILGAAVGALLTLPFALIPFGDLPAWGRLLIVAVTGALVGGTVAFEIAGGFAPPRPETPLATERGVTLSVPATPDVAPALGASKALRLDEVDDAGRPVRTVAVRPPESIARTLARHAAEEERRG
jgi:hypothetical protein